MHGLALNVHPDMSNYELIVPCGISEPGRGVCSVQQHAPDATIDSVVDALIDSFQDTFQVDFVPSDMKEIEGLLPLYPESVSVQLKRE
jgi:lipoate-protein ligase B